MKWQVYANGTPVKDAFSSEETAKSNMVLWKILNPSVKFELKKVEE